VTEDGLLTAVAVPRPVVTIAKSRSRSMPSIGRGVGEPDGDVH